MKEKKNKIPQSDEELATLVAEISDDDDDDITAESVSPQGWPAPPGNKT